MYCSHCGNQIKNDSKFCPYCGGSLSSSDIGSAKEALKNTAVAVMDSAKAIGNSVNEATGEQAQKYAEKAKKMAKGFTDDIKQVTKDKDTSNFFAKNKYRNVKILAVLLIAIIILCSMFSGKIRGVMENITPVLDNQYAKYLEDCAKDKHNLDYYNHPEDRIHANSVEQIINATNGVKL